METLMTREEVLNIPSHMYPCPVLSDNLRSFFSWGIKVHEEGCYNHFMWLVSPGTVVSQDLTFKMVPISEYFDRCRLKFWCCPSWTHIERLGILHAVEKDLRKPWYKRLYDWPAIIGQLFHQDWIQVPGLDICSDKGNYLALVDSNYNLKHPDPEEVNRWLMKYPKYQVLGRYMPD